MEEFGQPDGWAFWGERGARWIVCRGNGFVHFRVKVNRQDQHRLAIIETKSPASVRSARGQWDSRATATHGQYSTGGRNDE